VGAATPEEDAPRIRHIVLDGDAAQRGAAHGDAYAKEIRRYTRDRVSLASDGSWAGRALEERDVLNLADSMLSAHRHYAPDLFEEMEAMAAASGISSAQAIIVGGFTDFVDAVREESGAVHEEDDCTAVLVPEAFSDGPGWLAQTWDMHDSATQHVVLLDIRPLGAPRAFVFSTVGCLGQIGVNDAGIAVGINNLAAARGVPGVTWPFVVRKVLAQRNLDDALACVLEAPLAGAHHYLLMDAEGRGFDVEAMPQHRAVRELAAAPLIHTNHCLDEEALRHQAPRPPDLLASSEARLARAGELLREPGVDLERLMALTRDPVAICQRSKPPFHIESSGAAIMRPAAGELWAVWGLPSENRYDHFRFDA